MFELVQAFQSAAVHAAHYEADGIRVKMQIVPQGIEITAQKHQTVHRHTFIWDAFMWTTELTKFLKEAVDVVASNLMQLRAVA